MRRLPLAQNVACGLSSAPRERRWSAPAVPAVAAPGHRDGGLGCPGFGWALRFKVRYAMGIVRCGRVRPACKRRRDNLRRQGRVGVTLAVVGGLESGGPVERRVRVLCVVGDALR